MNKCINPEYEPLLHAYELGMLSGADREKLELHLMECESCLQKARKFKDAARLMRKDADIHESVREMAEARAAGLDTIGPERREKPRVKTKWSRYVPALAITFAVLLLLILKPWQIEFRPTQEAEAFENRLAVMYFGFAADQDDAYRLGEITTDLLITDMTGSEYFQVVSSQRLYDILRLMGREGEKRINRDIATEVARRAKARWMLSGSILQVEPNIIVTSQLVNIASGDVMASERITGETGEEIFSVVDRLSAEIRKNLPLPEAAAIEPDPEVAGVSTNSLEAYRHYLEGREAFYRYNWQDAARKLRKALGFDSTFASGYLLLATAQFMMEDAEAGVLIGKAMTYRDKSDLLQKHYIDALNEMIQENYTASIEIMEEIIRTYPDEKLAHFWLGAAYRVVLRKPEISISYFEKAIELDSMFSNAYEQLAAAYHGTGDDKKATWAVDRCIALAPEEPYPYYRKGLIYHARDEIDSAIALYEKALEKEPDYYHSLSRLVYLYLWKKEFDKAESCYRKLAEQPQKNLRSDARTGPAVVKLFQGKLDEALGVLDEGIAVDSLEQTYHGAEGDMANKYLLKAKIYVEKDSLSAAVREIEKCMEACKKVVPLNIPCYLDDYVWILAESGRIAEAEEISEQLKAELEAADEPLAYYWYARGHIDLAKGNPEAAIDYFRKASVRFALGKAYYAAGQYEEAAAVYEEAISRLLPYEAIWGVKAHYYLGLVYEQLGKPEEAAKQYGAFLDYWKDGDTWIEEIEDAGKRLSRLGGQSPSK